MHGPDHLEIYARLGRIEGVLMNIKEDIGALKVKSAVWGALAGLIPVTIGLCMYVLSVIS